jgi:hypothetical protein
MLVRVFEKDLKTQDQLENKKEAKKNGKRNNTNRSGRL